MTANEKTRRTVVELGIEARKQKERTFLELAGRFRSTNDPKKVKQLGDELGRLVFGRIATRSKP